MRAVSLFMLAISCSGAVACDTQLPAIYSLKFSMIDSAPPEGWPSAFVANHETVVPGTIRTCGAEFLAFDRAVTDGGEAAYFELKPDAPGAVTCIKRRIPQGEIVEVERTDELERLIEYERRHPFPS